MWRLRRFRAGGRIVRAGKWPKGRWPRKLPNHSPFPIMPRFQLWPPSTMTRSGFGTSNLISRFFCSVEPCAALFYELGPLEEIRLQEAAELFRRVPHRLGAV